MRRYLFLIFASIPVFLIPWMGPPWLIFSVYAFSLYFKDHAVKIPARMPGNSHLKFYLLAVAFGLLTETLAILDNLPRPPEDRFLLHPDLLVDLYLAFGYYSGFAIAWCITSHIFNLNHRDAFLIGGAFGILFERTGGLLFSLQVLAWPYVFLVYGSFQALPLLFMDEELNARQRRKISAMGKVLLGAGVEIISFLLAALFLSALRIIAGIQ